MDCRTQLKKKIIAEKKEYASDKILTHSKSAGNKRYNNPRKETNTKKQPEKKKE
jgi:hypothetical protein